VEPGAPGSEAPAEDGEAAEIRAAIPDGGRATRTARVRREGRGRARRACGTRRPRTCVRANEAAVWHCTVAPPGARHGAGHLSWARHEAAMPAGGLRRSEAGVSAASRRLVAGMRPNAVQNMCTGGPAAGLCGGEEAGSRRCHVTYFRPGRAGSPGPGRLWSVA
jgi:hypothetical protein